ncbi:hypothetical protein RHORCCE3_0128 [Rickettsia hoogstraalii str. RCCE3]|nr:hypothetical protein RHORCCE3_0128 [Rickettsia hoogstraalii str. RCCE3]
MHIYFILSGRLFLVIEVGKLIKKEKLQEKLDKNQWDKFVNALKKV